MDLRNAESEGLLQGAQGQFGIQRAAQQEFLTLVMTEPRLLRSRNYGVFWGHIEEFASLHKDPRFNPIRSSVQFF